MQLNHMPNHQSSAGGTEKQPAVRLVSGSLPVSIPLSRLRNVSFLQSPMTPMVEPGSNGSATNNNNYDCYKPSPTNGLNLVSPGDELKGNGKADHAKIKLETIDGEGTDGFNAGRPASCEAGSISFNPDSQSPPAAPPSTLRALRVIRNGREEEEEQMEEEEEFEPGVNLVIQEPEIESNYTGGGDEKDNSEQDDNKLAPLDQERMTQAVKKVFTEYKWTPPVAPIR
uniref:Uncharacterized protein n=1 Tax=Anopheles minimus TaxID=112268 RepID=A0A182VT28_9DIPT